MTTDAHYRLSMNDNVGYMMNFGVHPRRSVVETHREPYTWLILNGPCRTDFVRGVVREVQIAAAPSDTKCLKLSLTVERLFFRHVTAAMSFCYPFLAAHWARPGPEGLTINAGSHAFDTV